MSAPPPLPQGWTEHTGPSGQTYFYNAFTRESTYKRPLTVSPYQLQTVEKKVKPLFKTAIPGTEWLRVRTAEGNVFYSHKVRKESTWTIPEEIKEQVEQLDEERRQREEQAMIELNSKERREQSEEMEIERIKHEVQELVKRKATPLDEVVVTKKPRTGDDVSEDESDEDASDEEIERQGDTTEEPAADAQEQERSEEVKSEGEKINKMNEGPLPLPMPDRVNLSIEEAKALFKTLLREKDVNPLHPWDKSLPLFVSDPRYVLLPSVAARREAFDEYCRERARELKQSSTKKDKEPLDPKKEFEKLLTEEVNSTRTTWTEFRRTWKKDRRFYGWGRDDREREKRFREFVKELGEKKRAAAQKAEADFIALLKERVDLKDGLVWKDVKRELYSDTRYDAVGSSSLREELFNTFLKGKANPTSEATSQENIVPRDGADGKHKRKEQALKEREEKVRVEWSRLDAQIERSKHSLSKEEDERLFRTLLTDAIRDPQTWEIALPQLKTDPRFINSSLTLSHQLQLFHSHIAHLRTKYTDQLHGLFQAHAPSLATPFADLPISSLLSSLPVAKLNYNNAEMQHEYSKWQRERFQQCRTAFDKMLSENSFVEFWGRLGKMGGKGVDGSLKTDDLGEDEGETVDMKALAKNIDIGDMEKVIKNDKRYTAFDHIPDQREHWIRDYLANLSAPKLSVHVPERAAG